MTRCSGDGSRMASYSHYHSGVDKGGMRDASFVWWRRSQSPFAHVVGDVSPMLRARRSMRVAEHVPLRRKSSTVRSSSRPSVVVPLPLLGANDVAAGRSERRLLDGEVLERRLLSAPPRSQPALHGKGAGSQVRRDRNGDQQGAHPDARPHEWQMPLRSRGSCWPRASRAGLEAAGGVDALKRATPKVARSYRPTTSGARFSELGE
jgi:hypothetical protein